MKILEKNWLGYKAILSPNAGPTQIEKTKIAFYGGALALYSHIVKMGNDDVPEVEGVEMMKSLESEFEDFRKWVKTRGNRYDS